MSPGARTRRALLLLALAACGGDSTGPGLTTLTVGTPRTDVIGKGGAALYAVAVTPGAVYQVSLAGLSDDVDLYPFDDDQTFNSPAGCLAGHTLNFGTDDEDCIAVASGDTMYLAVDASDVGAANATYTILVEPVTPTVLTLSQPLEDSVARGGSRIYQVAVTPGTTYSLGITGLSDSATAFSAQDGDQFVFVPGVFSPKDWRLTAIGSTMYLAVEGAGQPPGRVTYRVMAAPAPVLTGAVVPTTGPVPFRTPTEGWVETRGSSRYRVLGLAAGLHSVSIVGLTGDANLRMYQDSTYSSELDCTLRNIAGAKECVVSGTDLFFAVSAGPLNLDGAGYIMLVW